MVQEWKDHYLIAYSSPDLKQILNLSYERFDW